MTQATQRAHLETIVNSVSDIGSVYPRQRWAIKWSDILALIKTTIDSTDTIRAWMITCLGHTDEYVFGELETPNANVLLNRTFNWRIQGFLSFNDSGNTEEPALNLATAVVNALNLASTLHSGTNYVDETPPASLDVFELRLFGGVLCHYIEISQQLTEVVALQSS